MPGSQDRPTALLISAAAELDICDGYVVLVFDPETGELDAHGPFEGVEAMICAERLRRQYDDDELGDVLIRVSRLHQPREAVA